MDHNEGAPATVVRGQERIPPSPAFFPVVCGSPSIASIGMVAEGDHRRSSSSSSPPPSTSVATSSAVVVVVRFFSVVWCRLGRFSPSAFFFRERAARFGFDATTTFSRLFSGRKLALALGSNVTLEFGINVVLVVFSWRITRDEDDGIANDEDEDVKELAMTGMEEEEEIDPRSCPVGCVGGVDDSGGTKKILNNVCGFRPVDGGDPSEEERWCCDGCGRCEGGEEGGGGGGLLLRELPRERDDGEGDTERSPEVECIGFVLVVVASKCDDTEADRSVFRFSSFQLSVVETCIVFT